jgi:3-oxoadipate enol-lactonase
VTGGTVPIFVAGRYKNGTVPLCPAKKEETVKTIALPGGEIAYVDRGAGSPILFVHGFPLDHTMWDGQIEFFAKAGGTSPPGARVLAPDLPGLGRSTAGWSGFSREDLAGEPTPAESMGASPSPRTMDDFADALAAFLDALDIREPVVYCGLSMGGYIAWQFWRRHAARLRALALCDTRATADTPDAVAGRHAMADRVLREGSKAAADAMLPRLFCDATRRDRPQLVERLRRMIEGNDPRGIASASLGMALRPDMTAALGEIACPTLVLVGQDDVISPPAEMRGIAEAIPRAKFVEIPDAGHMAPMENPSAVSTAIVEFLAML